MANRRPQPNGNGGRRMDFQRMDQRKNFERGGLSPWQGGGPGQGMPNLLPLGGGSTEATLALASNILNLLQPRQNPVPSLLDMPIRREFVPTMGRFDRCNFPPQRMVNHSNFRRTGNYNRAGERINSNRKQFKPNDGPRQQNKSPQKKEADSKAKPNKSETEEKKDKNETETEKDESKTVEVKKEPQKTRYDEVHTSLLKCHICNKSMWDGRSFENHLNGRAHAIMMQKAAESYALTADTMRQEFKIREMKRSRKTGQAISRDFYCAMCDMYANDGGVHRTTVGHRKLKKYLHPTCTSCHKEMPTRIEMDEHRLTVDHLRNIHDKQEDIYKPKQEVIVLATLAMEQSFLREDRQRKRRDHKEKAQAVATAAVEGDETAEESSVKKEPEDADNKNGVKSFDTEHTITDINEELDTSTITADQFPSYSTERGVGRSFLAEFKCVQCKLCNKLLDNEETAEVHLRTWKHYQLFVKALQPSTPPAPQETPSSGMKRLNDSDDGNWKRRRTEVRDDEADNANNEQDTRDDDSGIKVEELEGSGDVEMPTQDELEDWEQSVDEILDDEKNNHDPAETEALEAELLE